MLKIRKLKGTDISLRLRLEVYTDPREIEPLQLVNNLRRILLSEIEMIAIDKVIFSTNQSTLIDELLEHRISLVPIYTEDVNEKLKLNVECNKEEFFPCPIFSDYIVSPNKTVKIKQGIILAYLIPGHRIDATITLKKGTGKENIKFSPVTIVTFKELEKQIFELYFEVNEGYEIEDILRRALKILKEKYNEEIKIKIIGFKK
jgi:DNA-directed RNA polymerase alpha subunit